MRAPLNAPPSPFIAAINRRLFYGWLVLFAAAIGMFASGSGQSFTFSVFVDPIAADLQIGNTAVASAYGLATLMAAFALPYLGRLLDLFGARVVLLGVGAALGLACIGFSFVTDTVTLTIGFGVLRFLAQGSLMLICANMVAQWFSRRRGLAMSLMMLGFCASMAIYPPLGELLADGGEEVTAWRGAWPWFGILTWVVLLPVAIFLVRGRPEDVGLLPDNARMPDRFSAARGPVAITGATLKQALRSPTFYIVAASLFSLSMLGTALHFFQVSIFKDRGLDAEVAARVFTVIAVSMAVAMPLIGRLMDRFDPRYALVGALVCQSASLVAASLVSNLTSAMIYGVIFGINNAANMVIGTFVWPRYFGRRHLGSIMGVAQMVGVVGASVGPLPLGAGYDLFGHYSETLLLLALLPGLVAVAALFLKRPVTNY